MNFEPFPELSSDRLVLRRIELTDSENILFLRSDAVVNQFIQRPENRKTKTITDAKKIINDLNAFINANKSIAWGITLKNDPEIKETICLWNFSENNTIAEVGYDLIPLFHKMGIMNEAINLVLMYGFSEIKLDKIEAFTHFENESSKKLLLRNGFLLNENRIDPNVAHNRIFELENPEFNRN